jgi:hypothetical protein
MVSFGFTIPNFPEDHGQLLLFCVKQTYFFVRNSITLTLITKPSTQQIADLFVSIQVDNSLSISGNTGLLVEKSTRNRLDFR